ncbi:MAG: GNAT family N-acetyltransferase [Oscillospiraceae bacterium]|nr:GNAT family N-acetyltransferase [Oscillospiraceae bacterium]
MRYDAKKITLKDGRKCILRSPLESDAAEMLRMRIRAAGESDFLMRYPEEFNDYPLDAQIKFISNTIESEDILMLTAFVDGKLAGNCSISFNNSIKTRHRGEIGVGILKEYWGLGIGSAFFEELINTATNRNGITQLELDVFDKNERAIALYKKFGFEIVGTIPEAIRLKDGTMMGVHTMIKKL